MTMADRVAELRELEKAATPGPWAAEDTRGQRDWHGFDTGFTIRHGTHGHYGWDQADAAVAVGARNALPALLDVVEAARGAYEFGGAARLRAALAKLEADE